MGINRRKVSKQLGRKQEFPVHGDVKVAPVHLKFAFVGVAIAPVCHLILGMNTVLTRIQAERKSRPFTENVGQLSVEIVEEIVQGDVVFVRSVLPVIYGKERACEQIEPAPAQTDVIRCTSLADGAFGLHAAVKQTDAVTAVKMVEVAVARAHVNHRRQAAAIACREAAFIEIDVLHHIRVERRKQSERVVYLIKRCSVNQEEVLIVVAAVHIKAAHQLYSLRNATGSLQGFHHVGAAEQREFGLDVADVQRAFARLRVHERRV